MGKHREVEDPAENGCRVSSYRALCLEYPDLQDIIKEIYPEEGSRGVQKYYPEITMDKITRIANNIGVKKIRNTELLPITIKKKEAAERLAREQQALADLWRFACSGKWL